MTVIPANLRNVLPSYDLSKIDPERSKRIIIQRILNYGDWTELQWLYRRYPEAEIRKVVSSPSRGIWFEDVLDFWCLILEINLPESLREEAIFRPGP